MKTMKLKSYRKLAVNFLILTVNLLVIILYFTLSQAKVSIVPVKDTFSHTVTVPIREEVQASDGLAIAGSLATVDVSHEQTFTINETSEVPAQAKGEVTLYNTTPNRNQVLVRNTRLQNDAGLEIKTDTQVQLAPGQSIVVPVYATNEGAEGNVSSGRFQIAALPYLKDKIYAEITTPLSGGVLNVKAVTPTTFSNAREQIEIELSNKAWQQLSEQYDALPPRDQMTLEITTFDADANPGDIEIDSFTASAEAVASIFVYDEDRALEIVKQELVKNIPADKILLRFEDGSYVPQLHINEQTLSATISAIVQPKLSDVILNQEDIIGMNEAEVQEHFQKITGIRNVEVKFWPFWVQSVPNLKDHVDIEIKQ